MKTLNEVIKAFECCEHGELNSKCEDCPYNGIGACTLEREADGLNYLKEYQRYQNRPSCNEFMDLYAKKELEKWKKMKTLDEES